MFDIDSDNYQRQAITLTSLKLSGKREINIGIDTGLNGR